MATLAAFLSLADRMRGFSGYRPTAWVNYDPEILSFLDDTYFIDIARDLDLWDWEPKDAIGGYRRGQTNPNTRIIVFTPTEGPPPRQDEDAWIGWKDTVRDGFREKLSRVCKPLFEAFGRGRSSLSTLTNLVSNTCAELVLNAGLWGEALAFVAVQRTTKGITVAVCDAGHGLKATLSSRSRLHTDAERTWKPPATDLEAIVLASLVNSKEKDFGLRKAISQVTTRRGWIIISSGNALVEWRKTSWGRAIRRHQQPGDPLPRATDLFAERPEDMIELADLHVGHFRVYDCGLRGVRVTFEIPL